MEANLEINKRYEILRSLGSGAYGEVFLAKDKNPKDIFKTEIPLVAIKKMKNLDPKEGLHFTAIREIKYLKDLHHPNIISLLDIFYFSMHIWMVLEYMHTDLLEIITDKTIILEEPHIKCILKQILSAMAYLHENWVIHRDIKPQNILINKNGDVKLCDFGFSRSYGSPRVELTKNVATKYYRAPEILFGTGFYGPEIDIWGIGCIFGEMMIRVPLFYGCSDIDQLTKIFTIRGTPNETNWKGVESLPNFMPFEEADPVPLFDLIPHASESALNLLDQMLQLDPKKRISARQALEHEYFKTSPLPCDKNEIPLPKKGKIDK